MKHHNAQRITITRIAPADQFFYDNKRIFFVCLYRYNSADETGKTIDHHIIIIQQRKCHINIICITKVSKACETMRFRL